MDVTAVHQATNLWAMKKVMDLAKQQMAQTLATASPRPVSLDPLKGTQIDVRV